MYLWCYCSSQLNTFFFPSGWIPCVLSWVCRSPKGYGMWTSALRPGLWHRSAVCDCCGCGLVTSTSTRHVQAPWPSRRPRLAPCAPVLCWNGAGQAPCAPSRAVLWLCLRLQTYPQGGKCPSFFFFSQRRFAAKSITWEMKVAGRGEGIVSLFSLLRSESCCFAFFSPRNISPLPRCTLKKRAKAAARQGISSRHTARYGKPCLSEGRPPAMSLWSIMPRH